MNLYENLSSKDIPMMDDFIKSKVSELCKLLTTNEPEGYISKK